MAKERKVTYVLDAEASNTSKAAFREMAEGMRNVKREATDAARAVKEALTAAGRSYRGGSAGGRVTGDSTFARGLAAANQVARTEQREREAILRDSARAAERAARDEQKTRERAAAEQAASVARERQLLAERVRANVDANRRITEAARAARAEGWQRRNTRTADQRGGVPVNGIDDNDAIGHVNALGRAYDREYSAIARAERSRAALANKAWKETRQAAMAAVEGVMLYARSVVLAVAADDESAERALRNIARFQAFADVLLGTIRLIDAGAKAWRAYQASAAAAAAAQALASRGGAVGAAGSIASSSGGRFAAGAAVGGGAGLLGASGFGGAVSAAAAAAPVALAGSLLFGVGLLAASATASLAKGKGIVEGWKDLGDTLVTGTAELLGLSDMAGKNAKAWQQSFANVAGRQDELSSGIRSRGEAGRSQFDLRLEAARFSGAYGLSGLSRDVGGSAEAIQAARAELASAQSARSSAFSNNSLGLGALDIREQSLLREEQAGRRVIELEKEHLQNARAVAQEKIKGVRETITELERERDKRQQILDDEIKNRQTAAERFGQLSASEQQRTLAAVRAQQAGGQLTPEQASLIRNVGLTKEASAADTANAFRGGFAEIAAILDQKINAARTQVAKAEVEISNKVEVVAKLELEADVLADKVAESVRPIFERLSTIIDEKLDAAFRQERLGRSLREAQSGT